MSEKKGNRVGVKVITSKSTIPIQKQETKVETYEGSTEIITPPYSIKDLRELKSMSTILQQCIDAYRQNISGFGHSLTYKDDETKKNETSEMKSEWLLIDDVIKYINFKKSFKDVWGQGVEHREECGNGYIEVIRDSLNMPAELNNTEPEYFKISKLGDPIQVDYPRNGKVYKRYERFRKFVQEISGKKTWFKEYGDPRIMDLRTGKYDESTPEQYRANEIIHLKIGDGIYGVPRWIGHLIHIYGARKAEELNYRYFIQGRHNPAAIILTNGILSEESEAQLMEYANSVESDKGAHKFLVIEVETLEEELIGSGNVNKRPSVELKSLSDMLQQDALFLEYDEASRLKVQSSFRIDSIYTAYSKDLKYDNANAAMRMAEMQVFIPERESLEFIINNQLLAPYGLQFVRVEFNKPDISDTEEVVRVLELANNVGALAPNDIRSSSILQKALGKELENFEIEEANIPASLRTQSNPFSQIMMQKNKGEDMINVLKDLRDLIEELKG